MRDWIAGSMAVLGTLLVVAGGTVIVLKAMGIGTPNNDAAATGPVPATAAVPPGAADQATVAFPAAAAVPAAAGGGRFALALRRLNAADRLIGWGILLLVLGAVAAGAISFNLGAEAGTR